MNETVASYLRTIPWGTAWDRAHAERSAVYATATAHALGLRGDDLEAVRIAAELVTVQQGLPEWLSANVRDLVHETRRENDMGQAAQIVWLAETFDRALNGAPEREGKSLEAVRAELLEAPALGIDREVIEALLKVQRIIQPVGT